MERAHVMDLSPDTCGGQCVLRGGISFQFNSHRCLRRASATFAR